MYQSILKERKIDKDKTKNKLCVFINKEINSRMGFYRLFLILILSINCWYSLVAGTIYNPIQLRYLLDLLSRKYMVDCKGFKIGKNKYGIVFRMATNPHYSKSLHWTLNQTMGAGLGSSGSFAVCSAGAFYVYGLLQNQPVFLEKFPGSTTEDEKNYM